MEDTGREVEKSNLSLHFVELTQEKVYVSFINASLIYEDIIIWEMLEYTIMILFLLLRFILVNI